MRDGSNRVLVFSCCSRALFFCATLRLMDSMQALLLGALQGVTEFLPISSDGHLVVMDRWLRISAEGRDALGFDILLHAGSLLAILIGFFDRWSALVRSLIRRERAGWRLLLLLVIATVPGAIAGLLFADRVAGLRSLTAAGTGFLVTACVLIVGERLGVRRAGRHPERHIEHVSIVQILWIGLAQAIALLPGVSRSGLTISTARAFGFSRTAALDISFLMAAPIIGGAVAKTLLDAWAGAIVFPPLPVSLTGLAASFCVSLLAILFLRRFVAKSSLAWFAWYLLPLGFFLLFEASGLREAWAVEHMQEHISRYGALALFFFAFVETIPPMSFFSPGIFVMLIGGSQITSVAMGILFFAAVVLGSLCGNALMYLFGRYFGRGIAHHFHLTEQRLHRAERLMNKYGRLGIVLGQFLGMARPAVGFLAGTLHMAARTYSIWMLAATLTWGALYLGLGFVLRGELKWLLSVTGLAGIGVPLMFIAISVYEFIQKKRIAARKIPQ